MDNTILQGQKSGWSLLEKLGEGDAGEVFLVEGVVDHRQAILKRPRKSVFTNDVRRQAEQIRQEGRLLGALEGLMEGLPGICVPGLLDQSKGGTEFSERYFIIIERASGQDLAWMARACRLGADESALSGMDAQELLFIDTLIQRSSIPDRILLAALSSLLTLFETIHTAAISGSEGVVWNDVKADHIFWDAHTGEITIIDWGNSRLLEAGGVSHDKRHTRADDQRQFLDEMGRFLSQSAPNLHERLGWPSEIPLPGDLDNALANLQGGIRLALQQENNNLVLARQEERSLLEPGPRPVEAIQHLDEIQRQIIAYGEIPDYPGALRLAGGAVSNLAASADLAGVGVLCRWAARLPGAPAVQWRLLSSLAEACQQSANPARMAEVVRSAAANDWEGCLWALLESLQSGPEPDWWNDVLIPVRLQAGGGKTQAIRPLLTLRRMAFTLQSASQPLDDRVARGQEAPGEVERLESIHNLTQRMRETAQNWVQLDPLPPHSGLAYSDLDLLIDQVDHELPGAFNEMKRSLDPARELAASALSAWNRREFTSAGKMLRALLVWDPDRRRLLRASQALLEAPDWLHRLRSGPRPGLGLQNFVTDLEFEGRDLRNRLGPAIWLDNLLEALKNLRHGTWPGSLILTQAALLADIPWLQSYERVETIRRALQPHLTPTPLPTLSGRKETRFGPESELSFIEPLDAWMPEARGSSARVYLCTYRAASGDVREGALKIMRVDKADYALPLFREEVLVLEAMRGVAGVNPLLESGFLWMGDSSLPIDQNGAAIRALKGDVLRLGPDVSNEFLDQLSQRTREGWTPYLILEKRRREDNLLLLCDASLNRGSFLATTALLRMAIQICDILVEAHQRNVVYRDHKILHYYWQNDNNGIYLIDWNVAQLHPGGLSEVEMHMDMVQLGARGLHHILTGRTAPGALPLGPTRPEEIDQSALSYRAQWTYDDQRLSEEIRTILEQLLAGSYTNASDLRDDLKRAYMNLE